MPSKRWKNWNYGERSRKKWPARPTCTGVRFVETGAAEAGIVYATDAAASRQVRIATRLDPKLSEPIRYPIALLKHGADNRAATAFYDFLNSADAAKLFRERGFVVLEAKTKP